MKRQSTIVRASEVGEYVYCARAWWLRRVAGLEPTWHERRAAGVALHRRHSSGLRLSSTLLALALALLMLALVMLAL